MSRRELISCLVWMVRTGEMFLKSPQRGDESAHWTYVWFKAMAQVPSRKLWHRLWTPRRVEPASKVPMEYRWSYISHSG